MRKILAALLAAAALGGGVARAEIIDRILAVVDGSIITQSDLLGALRLGLLGPEPSRASIPEVLDRLIERRLILSEVERYAPPDPPDAEVDRRVAELRAAAGSAADVESTLKVTGITPEQLRRLVRDELRINSYLEQRFGAAIQPVEEEILQYYRDHQARFTRGGTVVPYADARGEARAALAAERRSATIGQWVSSLRRRANVNVLPFAVRE